MTTKGIGPSFLRASLVASLLLVFPTLGSAQDAGFVWQNATELSFVSTGGNASSSTLGLKAALTGTGAPNTMKIELGGVRGESDVRSIRATGTTGSFAVTETSNAQKTAEAYFARGRYDRALTGAYLFSGAGWDRNTFAGIQDRYAFVAGVGRTWVEGAAGKLKTDVGATYTIQNDVSGAEGRFGGVRVGVEAVRQLAASTQFSSLLVTDMNLEETEDTRADWINSLSVGLSSRLAFKTSLQLLIDNLPSLLTVPLFDTGGTQTGTVLHPGDKVDRVLTVALVITL